MCGAPPFSVRTRSPELNTVIGTSAAATWLGLAADPSAAEVAAELEVPQQAECAATADAVLSRRRHAAVRSRPKHTASSPEGGEFGGAESGGEATVAGGGGEPLTLGTTETLTFCAAAQWPGWLHVK